jgi:4-amino-4-deoxy-L-arabinose transferase-like glycosyltransferase
MLTEKNKISFHLLGLLVLVYFIVFLKLDSFHMRWWDESMFAVNTYEMLHNGKYFSTYFDGLPDILNTKPPLTSWLQIIFVKVMGYNELALRLPSAIAAALSILLLFKFMAENYNLIWAWLSALVLLTSQGFINFHTARTGDADSLLTFFLLAANIYFLKYLVTNGKINIFLFLLFISFAFATKMYAALLFSPAYLIILIHQKKLRNFILNKEFLLGVVLFLFMAIGLIYAREQDTPGYIKEIVFKDAGRIFSVVENHKESGIFYFDNLFTTRFPVWFVFLIIGSLFAFIPVKNNEKHLLLILVTLSFVYLIIITVSITKLVWYDMPLYPYLSTIAAYPLCVLLRKFSFDEHAATSKQTVFLIAFIFAYPYYSMYDKSQGNTIPNGEKILEANERYIFKSYKENKNLNGIKVYYFGYKGSFLFYKYKLAEKNQEIELVNNGSFAINDKVLVCNDSLKIQLSQKFKYITIDSYDKSLLLQLTEKRD